MKTLILNALFFCVTLVISFNLSWSDIYKYQDDAGNWHYTDTPQTITEDMETMSGMVKSPEAHKNLTQKLTETFKPLTPIEQASIATVTVISAVGKGSGFFITTDGYIITNRHVIKGDETEDQKAQDYFSEVDERIKDAKAYFQDRERELKQMKQHLDAMKKEIDQEPHPIRKRRMQEAYERDLARYQSYKNDLYRERKDFRERKNEYMDGKRDYTWRATMADLKKSFTIILKDSSEVTAHLVKISKRLDLALLKLEGYTTPVLKASTSKRQRQGQQVYAIGSPIGIRDSVCSGVISGFSETYVKTDAQIYPGNSGGPLVNKDGQVIGINTLKMITHKFEGLGFAIPIESALEEFQNEIGHIPMN